MESLRILIADDHAAIRRAIRTLLESHDHWKVCGEATNGTEAVELAEELKPDVVVLDVTMPKLNGLEAARRIRQQVPDARVVMLTMHEANELADEVRRAGGHDVILKSDAHAALIRAIESLRAKLIHLGGSVVDTARHIGAFFHSEEERYEILGSFIAEGLANGEKAIHIIDPPARGKHIEYLKRAGIDAARAESQHQLDLIPWEDAYLRGGEFDQDAMIKLLDELLSKGSADGFPMTRAIAHMEWALEDRPGVADLVEYEVRVNNVLARFHDVVICAYDLTKFPGDTIMDLMRGHPAVVIGGSLRANPFYAPDKMLEELRERVT